LEKEGAVASSYGGGIVRLLVELADGDGGFVDFRYPDGREEEDGEPGEAASSECLFERTVVKRMIRTRRTS
jgi:hypothetical protein